jgi:uncharacterized protein (TIGR04376 family)
MGLLEDMKQFLESQIDDFLSKNPHLELQIIEEQLAQQERDTFQLIVDLQSQEKQTEQAILDTAQEIKNWYDRVQKATNAGRVDLAQAAQARVDTLLPQGNLLWGKMQGLKERKAKAKELLETIKQRHAEVKKQAAATQGTINSNMNSWGTASYPHSNDSGDPLDEQFRRWEAEEELQNLKRNLGK